MVLPYDDLPRGHNSVSRIKLYRKNDCLVLESNQLECKALHSSIMKRVVNTWPGNANLRSTANKDCFSMYRRSPLNAVETLRTSRSNAEGPKTRFSFGLGKRSDPNHRFGFGLGKRNDPSQRFGFGLGKRSDANRFGFGLGKRDDMNQRFGFGLGKRSDANRFGFGLGKRNVQKPRFGFGLGKRSDQLEELIDQLQLKDGQAKEVLPYITEEDALADKRAPLVTFPPVASAYVSLDVDPMTLWSDRRPFSEYKRTRFMLGKNLPVYNFGLGK